MFDTLSRSELVGSLGRTMRAAGKGGSDQAGRDDFARVQLLSGSSLARYLSEELRFGPALWDWFVDTVVTELADPAENVDADAAAEFSAAAARIRSEPAVEVVGAELGDLLAGCRTRRGPGAEPGAAEWALRRRLRELADRQVTMLTGEDPLAASQGDGR